MRKYLEDLADRVVDWLYDNGHVETLSSLATNTTALRGVVLSIASASAAYGVTNGSWSESAISFGIVLLTWGLNSFIAYVKDKHAKEVQELVGAKKVDGFIGKETVDAVKETVLADAKELPVKTNEKA